MKLQRIRYFVTLAQTLSFSRTADIHYVSQTTVSQQIQALEAELGVSLFSRTKRKVSLTPAGRVFLDDAQKILDLVDHADEKMHLFKDANAEQLTLSIRIASGVTPGYIAPFLNEFKGRNPDIALRYQFCRARDVYPALATGEADTGIVLNVLQRDHPDTIEIEIGRMQHYIVVSNRSHLAQYPVLTREQLKGVPQVNLIDARDFIPAATQAQDDAGSPADEAAPAKGTEARRPDELDYGHSDVLVESMDELLLAVSLGEGYTPLAESVVDTIIPSLNLAAIPLDGEKIPLIVSVMGTNDNPAARRFVDFARSR